MNKHTMLSQTLDKLDRIEYLDAAGKTLLSYRKISAFILKACIPELSELSLDTIADECIIGEPDISNVHVHRDSSARAEKPEKINQAGNEDTDVDEGKVTYDVRFVIRIPGDEEYTKVYVNLEAQNKFNPGYPLVKRGLYYDARMISAQYGVEFEESDYGKIKKVYSIWICINPKKEYQNSINRYRITESQVFGNIKLPEKDYDIMETIMVCLHTNGDEGKCGNKLVDMLSLLFSRNETSKNKKSKLEKEYEIRMTKEYDEVVDKMCNISGYYTEYYDAAMAAKAELAAKDEELAFKNEELAFKNEELAFKNEELAAKDDEIAEKNRMIAEMMITDGKASEEIVRYTGLDVDTLKQIAKSLGKPLVM